MRVFLSLRGLARSACFPGLGPSVRHAPVCSSIESWLSAGPTSPREKALFLYAEMTANLPHTRKLLHSPRHPLLAYSEMACQGCWQGLLFWALKRCLLNGHLVVYTFFLPYYRSTFTRSPVSVSSLLETFSGPAQDCSVLVNRGELWEEVWDPKPSGTTRSTSRP